MDNKPAKIQVESFWQEFLAKNGLDKNLRYYESFYFGNDEKMCMELLALVILGKKRATCSSLSFFEATNTRPPEPGDYSVVTDWYGLPACIMKTTKVTVLAFSDMTFDICKREGEDETLESWRDGHIRFFTRDAEEYGYTFSEDMPVIFEDFDVLLTKIQK